MFFTSTVAGIVLKFDCCTKVGDLREPLCVTGCNNVHAYFSTQLKYCRNCHFHVRYVSEGREL